MTEEQFFDYIRRIQAFRNAQQEVEQVLHKYNEAPTLTMFPDFGELHLIFDMLYDNIYATYGKDSADLFADVWYESEIEFMQPQYETDDYSIYSVNDLWEAILSESKYVK